MSDRFTGKVISDKYRVDGFIGDSRSGRLYTGKHLLMGNTVTIKVLDRGDDFDEAAAAGFSAEARAVSKIGHPNILNITDFGQDIDGTIFAVMEDASGKTLRNKIADESPLAVETAVRISRQVAAALGAAHSRGIFHGSLTSGKAVLSKIAEGAELVKVFDIGAYSTLPRNSETPEDLDELAYRAPELFVAGSKPDERSDVYSLGILLYELLAGERPFTGESENELSQRHNQVPPPPLVAFRNDLPEGLEIALLGALAKDPSKRYASISEFIEALNVVVEDLDTSEGGVVPIAAEGADSNNGWKTAFIVLAGISVLAFGLIYLTGTNRTEPPTVLQTDSNSQPVQPINPATGMSEQSGLRAAPQILAGDPNALPEDFGGDGMDPWANPGTPPPGGSAPIGPPGDYVTIPGEGSVFMPGDGGVILVPKIVTPTPTPESTPAAAPSKTPAANTNTQPPRPAATSTPRPEPKEPPAGESSKPPVNGNKSVGQGDSGSGN